jgi:hypothetical protein
MVTVDRLERRQFAPMPRSCARFTTDPSNTLAFDPHSGACVGHIDFEDANVSTGREYANGLVFGPGGFLYVPMRFEPTGGLVAPDTAGTVDIGQVRRYDVSAHTYTDFTPPLHGLSSSDNGATLERLPTSFFYPVFGKTDPTYLTSSD